MSYWRFLTSNIFNCRISIFEKIDTCAWALFVQSHSISVPVLLLQVTDYLLHTNIVCPLTASGWKFMIFVALLCMLQYQIPNSSRTFSFSFISGISGTSLFNSVSLMAYNVFYTSLPVLVSVLDKDLSERTVMQHPQILYYCQAGRCVVFCGIMNCMAIQNFVIYLVVSSLIGGMFSLILPALVD